MVLSQVRLAQVDQRLHDLVLCFHRLGIGLVVPLVGDQIHQFLRQVDVRFFDRRGRQQPQVARFPRRTQQWRSGFPRSRSTGCYLANADRSDW